MLTSSPLPAFVPAQILFVIAKPEVLKSPNSDTHIIFGEAKIEDLSAQAQNAAAQTFKADMGGMGAGMGGGGGGSRPRIEEEDEGPVDESGVDPKDVELVITQAGVSRAKAVQALKQSGGDIVSAIMELTM